MCVWTKHFLCGHVAFVSQLDVATCLTWFFQVRFKEVRVVTSALLCMNQEEEEMGEIEKKMVAEMEIDRER